MRLHHPEGTNQAQAQTSRVLAQYESAATGGARSPRRVGKIGRRRYCSLLQAVAGIGDPGPALSFLREFFPTVRRPASTQQDEALEPKTKSRHADKA
ncbi:MAG: hypothetical protein DME20_10840 [Verrucomicrobia bacterium]|nr:MAG: hypothetical protein DME20_10840 [Verrucomicrobiota bacterium]